MSDLTVTKVVAYIAEGPAPPDLAVTKVVKYIVIDTGSVEVPADVPAARRRVRVTARAAYSPT